ncbi:MAG: SufE family protein [Flavobacteriales bacterium]
MNITETQNEIIEEFELFDDWMDKYEHIIEIGTALPAMEASLKTEENLVKGCQSNVWLNAEVKGGKLIFTADSDALITKGLIGLLLRVFSGQNPNEILQSELFFINRLGLSDHLSPNRANGLSAMVNRIKMHALATR